MLRWSVTIYFVHFSCDIKLAEIKLENDDVTKRRDRLIRLIYVIVAEIKHST